jgi:FtsZ-interacting cell division protein YlmF
MNYFSNSFTSNNWTPYDAGTNNASVSRILDGQRQNGLVQIAISEDPDARFRMHERVSNHNKSTSYYDALNGTLEWSQLAESYFSADNLQKIQESVKQAIYEKSAGSITVPNRDVDQMKTIMRDVYLQYAEHSPADIAGQVARLNKIVVGNVVPKAYSEAQAYLRYLQDQSMLTVPMERGGMSDRIYKQLEPRPFVDVRPSRPYL